MDGALVILFQAAFSLAVYCVAEALCKTVICMDAMLAIFLIQLSHLLRTLLHLVHIRKPSFT